MFITSRMIRFVLFGLVLLSGSAWAAAPAIQGEVKGPDGKAIKGANVQIERRDAKAAVTAVKTDQKGQFTFKDLALGTYALRVSANGMAPTAVEKVKTREDGAVRINFNLKNLTGSANAAPVKKKATHMVYVPAETGSNLGGRWVEVDDQGTVNTAGADNVQKGGNGTIKGMQSGGGNTHGN